MKRLHVAVSLHILGKPSSSTIFIVPTFPPISSSLFPSSYLSSVVRCYLKPIPRSTVNQSTATLKVFRAKFIIIMAFVSLFTPSITQCNLSSSSFISPRRARTAHPIYTVPINMTATDKNVPPTTETDAEPREVIIDENIAGFCSIDPRSGKRDELSLRDKESLFLDAMQAFFNGESVLNNEEFDLLKEELTWQGSDVVTLSREEYRFLDAARAYEEGKPTMNDEEFDRLKKQLFEAGSVVAIQRGPRCSVQRKITFSDVIPDKKRTLALYIPAAVVSSLFWLSASFELTPLHNVDPVLSLLIGSPIIYILSRIATNLVVPNATIMVGDCPSCGRRTHVLFGNVLNQKGFEDEAAVRCDKCKSELKVEKESGRMILMKQA